jgi:ABC-type glycerol-3-phosphate transport system permease component
MLRAAGRRLPDPRAGLGVEQQDRLLEITLVVVIIAIAPVVIVFLFAQRTLVKGMLAGATKG